MKRLWHFLKTKWEDVFIWGLAINLSAWSVTTGNPLLIGITVVSISLIIILLYTIIERTNLRRLHKIVGENTAFKTPRKAIIFTVGMQYDTIAFAIENQKPDFVGFICTERTQSRADELMLRFNLKNGQTARKRIVDPFDVGEIHGTTFSLIDWIIQQGVRKNQLVVDVTGGMTTMSVGVFAAAEERQIDSQYIRSQFDVQNQIIPNTMEGIFVVNYPHSKK